MHRAFSSPTAAWLRRHHRPLLFALLVAVFVWQWAITLREARDFGVYYKAGQRVITGARIYEPADPTLLSYKYSPVFAFLFVPLALLPIKVAQTIWFAVNLLLTLALPLLAYRLVRRPDDGAPSAPDHRFWVCTFAIALSLRYVLLNATAGQVVALQLALMLGGLVLLERGRTWSGGACLGLAILVKIIPVLLLGYLVLRRRWRAIAVACLATAGWALLPALRYGFAENVRLHLDWLAFVPVGNTLDQLTRPQNQSILSLATRLLVDTPYHLNAVALPLDAVTRFYAPVMFGGCFALLAVLYRWIRRAPAGLQEERTQVALVALLMYLTVVSPLAWRYNYLTVIVAWTFVGDRILRGQRRARTLAWVAVSVALGALTTRDVLGRRLEDWTHLLGVEMWAGCLAVVACFDLARAPRRTDEEW